jgi:hypothetical protein
MPHTFFLEPQANLDRSGNPRSIRGPLLWESGELYLGRRIGGNICCTFGGFLDLVSVFNGHFQELYGSWIPFSSGVRFPLKLSISCCGVGPKLNLL